MTEAQLELMRSLLDVLQATSCETPDYDLCMRSMENLAETMHKFETEMKWLFSARYKLQELIEHAEEK